MVKPEKFFLIFLWRLLGGFCWTSVGRNTQSKRVLPNIKKKISFGIHFSPYMTALQGCIQICHLENM